MMVTVGTGEPRAVKIIALIKTTIVLTKTSLFKVKCNEPVVANYSARLLCQPSYSIQALSQFTGISVVSLQFQLDLNCTLVSQVALHLDLLYIG